MLWMIIPVLLTVIGYWTLIRPYKFWTDRAVKQTRPLPLLGDSYKIFFRLESVPEMVCRVYNKFPCTRYSGMYQFTTPTLTLRDPDLIKQITVKDFDHFLDHHSALSEEIEPYWTRNLFALKGQKWREMRSTLSPAFTSSKMRYMFSLIVENAEQFVKYFLKQDKDVITVELKDTFTKFTNDVIANTSFGVEVDSLSDPNNEFYLMGKEITDFNGLTKKMKILGYFAFPWLYKKFEIRLFSSEVSRFFKNLISDNIASREKHRIVRPDMINILVEARKNGFRQEESQPSIDTGFATAQDTEIPKKVHQIEITNDDITSQAMIFFLAGFDTVSTAMCFLAYELGANHDIQERLRQEIDDTLQASDGKITYEALLSMKYLDMVVSESLRKWPAVPGVDRVCTKPYTIRPETPDERLLYLEKGSVVWLPIFGIHHDPVYYFEPEKFDPERFSDENKHKIRPYTYMPFGSGPRSCIGSRFALLEIKVLFFHILANFEIVPVAKTQIPLKISRKSFNVTSEGGFWFGLKRR